MSQQFKIGRANNRRLIYGSLLVLFLGLSLALQYKIRISIHPTSTAKSGLEVRGPAPEFKLEDIRGNPLALADFRGKLVILDFWATWCGPCRMEFEDLKTWAEKRRKEGKWENVVLLAVNLREEAAQVIRFTEENKLPFIVLLDRDGAVGRLYNVNGIPSLFVVDPMGIIIHFQEGFAPGITRILDGLIEGPGKSKSS